MGYRFKCTYCSKRYKTVYGRRAHEDKSCTAIRAPAGVDHGADNPASDPESGGSSVEDMVIDEINRERATRNGQEPLKLVQEHGITMEGLNYEEDRKGENLGRDRKKGENRNDLPGDHQENEENQNAPTPDEPQG